MIASVSQAVGLRKISLSGEESSSSGIHISTVCLLWCSSMQMGISFRSCVKCKQCSKGSPREGCVFVSKIHLVNLHQLLEEEMGSIASNEFPSFTAKTAVSNQPATWLLVRVDAQSVC